MATIEGANIVRNGLVLNLDAANPKSYPRTGTTWRDLSGNNFVGSLINGPSYNSTDNGVVVFDGTNDYISVPDDPLLRLVGECTICFWVKPTLLKDYGNLIWKANYPTNGYGIITLANGAVELQVSPSPGPNPSFGASTLVNGQWSNLCVSLNSSKNVVFYKNGNLKATATSIYSILSGTTSLRIAADTDNNRYFNGTISQVLIYNKVITSQEVLQNFNATKARYGL